MSRTSICVQVLRATYNSRRPKVKLCFYLIVGITSAAVCAQPDLTLYNATRYGAMLNIRLQVVDSDGCPVPDARLLGGLQMGDRFDDFTPIEGMTDAKGEYVIGGKCTRRLRCSIKKSGYYPSDLSITYPINDIFPPVVDGKWQPYGETMTVVLKKIKCPGRNCAFPDSLRRCRIPEFDRWLGFDFECADWTSPYGSGSNSDVLLKFSSMERSMQDYRYAMEVSFTNNPYAGVYLLKEDRMSKFTTAYVADSNATYSATFSSVCEQHPGMPRHLDILDRDSYLVFRTRTRVDEHGNLVGAHYGKILGRWFSDKEFMIMSDGCFNQVENDVNIEDGSGLRDLLRNLRDYSSDQPLSNAKRKGHRSFR